MSTQSGRTGGHFIQSIQDISTSLKEISKWRGEVDKRLEILETTQASQHQRVDDLETETLLSKEKTKQIEQKISTIQETIRGSCTRFILEIFLIILCIWGLIISIYYIVKNG
jgi:uncharacterized coiled-coil protein SlyX